MLDDLKTNLGRRAIFQMIFGVGAITVMVSQFINLALSFTSIS